MHNSRSRLPTCKTRESYLSNLIIITEMTPLKLDQHQILSCLFSRVFSLLQDLIRRFISLNFKPEEKFVKRGLKLQDYISQFPFQTQDSRALESKT